MVLMIHGATPVIVIVATGRSHRRGKDSSTPMWSEGLLPAGISEPAQYSQHCGRLVFDCVTSFDKLDSGRYYEGATSIFSLYVV
jgi:hypothetical protein